MRAARREDVGAIVALLADDDLGASREVVSDPPAPGYLEAFEAIAANPRTLLAVAEDAGGGVVGTLELTFIPGLSNQGAELALVSAVRVSSGLRGQGLGETMMAWAMGCIPPPPAPCKTRQTSSMGSDGAAPQRKLATVKITMQNRKKLRRPITLEAHAPMGSTMAFETR